METPQREYSSMESNTKTKTNNINKKQKTASKNKQTTTTTKWRQLGWHPLKNLTNFKLFYFDEDPSAQKIQTVTDQTLQKCSLFEINFASLIVRKLNSEKKAKKEEDRLNKIFAENACLEFYSNLKQPRRVTKMSTYFHNLLPNFYFRFWICFALSVLF